MDALRKSPEFSGRQINVLLKDLGKNSSHAARLKGIKCFQDYIATYNPEIYDDDVDILYQGSNETNGLLYWCGAKSSKTNDNQYHLKRICGPTLSLLRWLINIKNRDNIFYERFICLPLEELVKINFVGHVLSDATTVPGSLIKSVQSKSLANCEDAYELISILVRNHQHRQSSATTPPTLLDERRDIEIDALLSGNAECRQKYMHWLQQSAAEEITIAIQDTITSQQKIDIRPAVWSKVRLLQVPKQEDEDEFGNEFVAEEVVIDTPVADPLGISAVRDLRQIMLINSSSFQRSEVGNDKLDILRSVENNRMSMRMSTRFAAGAVNKRASQKLVQHASMIQKVPTKSNMKSSKHQDGTTDNESNEQPAQRTGEQTSGLDDIKCILPTEKQFNAAMFLRIVHGSAPFAQFKTGLQHLQTLLDKQSFQRENLVRSHFGLFIKCAEGLEWVKEFRMKVISSSNKGAMSKSIGVTGFSRTQDLDFSASTNNSNCNGNSSGKGHGSNAVMTMGHEGEEKLRLVKSHLDTVKTEVQNSLAPIVKCILKRRKIQASEGYLKKLTTYLEFPSKIRSYFERNEYELLVSEYMKFIALPDNSYRILHKVYERVKKTLEEVRKSCTSVLLSTSEPNFSKLYKAAMILKSLDDIDTFRESLRQCFLKQFSALTTRCQGLYNWYQDRAAHAFIRGQEANIESKELGDPSKPLSLLALPSSQGKSMSNLIQLLDTTTKSKNPLGVNIITKSKQSLVFSEESEPRVRSLSYHKQSLSHRARTVLLDQDDDDDDDDLENESDTHLVISESFRKSGNASPARKSIVASPESPHLMNGGVQDEVTPTFTKVDHITIHCSRIRVHYISRLVALLLKWFPFFESLIGLIRTYKSGGIANGMTYGRDRSDFLPSDIFADSLFQISEMLRKIIFGFSITSTTSASSDGPSTPNLDGQRGILNHETFRERLRDSYLRAAIISTSQLYERTELTTRKAVMKGSMINLLEDNKSQLVLSSSVQITISNIAHESSLTAQFDTNNGKLKSRHANAATKHHNIVDGISAIGANGLKKVHLYNVATEILRDITKEGEIIKARKLVSRLHESIADLFSTNSMTSVGMINFSDDHFELVGNAFETLVRKCIKKLSSKCKRPNWINSIVEAGVIRSFDVFLRTLTASTGGSYSDNIRSFPATGATDMSVIGSPGNSVLHSSFESTIRGSADLNALDEKLLSVCDSIGSSPSTSWTWISAVNAGGREVSRTTGNDNSSLSVMRDQSRSLLSLVKTCVALRTIHLRNIFTSLDLMFPDESNIAPPMHAEGLQPYFKVDPTTKDSESSKRSSTKQRHSFTGVHKSLASDLLKGTSQATSPKASVAVGFIDEVVTNSFQGLCSEETPPFFTLLCNYMSMRQGRDLVLGPLGRKIPDTLLLSLLTVESQSVTAYIRARVDKALNVLVRQYGALDKNRELAERQIMRDNQSTSPPAHVSRCLLQIIEAKVELSQVFGKSFSFLPASATTAGPQALDSASPSMASKPADGALQYADLVYRELCLRILLACFKMSTRRTSAALSLKIEEELDFLQCALYQAITGRCIESSASTSALRSSANSNTASTSGPKTSSTTTSSPYSLDAWESEALGEKNLKLLKTISMKLQTRLTNRKLALLEHGKILMASLCGRVHSN